MSIKKNILAYNKKAANYDSTLDGKFTEKFKRLLVQSMDISDGDAVLDVGCGNGSLLSKIAETAEIRGFGTDISPGMIAAATERNPAFDFAVANCEQIPFGDGAMDVIIACASFHHFPNVAAFAAECKRLLRKGGSVYIAEIYLPPVIRHIANLVLPLSNDGDVKFYTTKEIADTFRGFRIVKATTNWHIQIVQLRTCIH
jgi:ubiquinone/menaquinone biosynthesis C-methylase UbiE